MVGEAEDGERAVALAHRLRPDVVVMDIRMPVLDGVRATEELARVLPRCRVLALSTFDMDEYVVGALRAGAYGFLPKDSSPEELIAAVRTVHAGEAAVAPRLLTRLISTYVRAPHALTAGSARGGPRRTDAPRGRGVAADRDRARQRADLGGARHQRLDGQELHHQHLRQARRP
ncbi:LuxR family transcriptional regulator [Streptomyces alboflavus]|uniref:LuxR family transcriptional regulator n=1 Tax=Streptomyces alboflavus TaxID=67267 RepID=A0A1Z1WS75_9ACTN|nr:LuxR family transcriptional regulator [Streptomyces alboflavus]